MRFVPHRFRSALSQLGPRLGAASAVVALVLGPAGLSAQIQPPPMPSSTAAPKTAQHAEYVVETNRKGQVTRIRSAKHASDPSFDARVHGNALQVFIRRPDGSAVAGVFRLTYDYNPQTKTVTRKVTLLQTGGVDPNAPGAVTVLEKQDLKILQQNAKAAHPPSPLPDFSAIIQK